MYELICMCCMGVIRVGSVADCYRCRLCASVAFTKDRLRECTAGFIDGDFRWRALDKTIRHMLLMSKKSAQPLTNEDKAAIYAALYQESHRHRVPHEMRINLLNLNLKKRNAW